MSLDLPMLYRCKVQEQCMQTHLCIYYFLSGREAYEIACPINIRVGESGT